MHPPARIVCLTEETTETLYLLGEQHRIVSVSGYTVVSWVTHEWQVLSCCGAEHLHGVKVLILNDEFRYGSLFAVIQEKIRQRVS